MPISPSQVRRFWALVLSLVIGYSLFVVYPRQSQQESWLLKDAQQGIAVVTKIGWTGHGGVTYQYRVNQVGALEGLLILTVMKPDSRWALAFGENHRFFLGPYPR